MKHTLLSLLVLLVMTGSVFAYNTDDLHAYYSFDDSNTSIIIDEYSTNLSIISGSGVVSGTGIQGNAFVWNSSATTVYNSTFSSINFTSDTWAINLWLYHNASTGTQKPFRLGNLSSNLVSGNGLHALFVSVPSPYLRFRDEWNTSRNYVTGLGTALSTTSWSMLTIQHDGSGTYDIYLNGVYLDSSASYFINSSIYYLMVGAVPFDILDEMSVWNDTLNVFDIATLYNSGNGLNYTNTLLGSANQTNATPLCIDTQYLCNVPLLVGTDVYCDVDAYEYCSGGCVNVNTTGTLTGECTNTCENECMIDGYTECESLNSRQVCGNYDSDACLEWSTGYSCAIGEVCTGVGNCVTNNGTGLSSNPSFSVISYSQSDDTTVYVINPSDNKMVTVSSKNFLHIQNFAILTSSITSYSQRACNYVETLASTTPSFIVNDSATASQSQVGSTSYIVYNVTPEDGINATITTLDSLSNNVSSIRLVRNVSAKSIDVYVWNGSEYIHHYLDVSVNSYDDLNSVTIKQFFEFVTQSYTYTLTFNRAQLNTISTQPKTFTSSDYQNILFEGNQTVSVINAFIVTQPQAFYETLRSDYNYLSCSYTTTGCRTVRTYLTTNYLPDFSNYADNTVCVDSLNVNSFSINADAQGYRRMDTGIGIIVVLAVAIIIVMIFAGVGMMTGMINLGFITGVAFAFGLIIASTIPAVPIIGGVFPAWIAILIFLIFFVLLIMFGLNPFTNREGG